MKYIYPVFLLSLLSVVASAQPWMQPPYLQQRGNDTNIDAINFYDVQKAFAAYEKTHDASNENDRDADSDDGEDEGKFQGYNQYKRWEWYNEQRLFPTGVFPTNAFILDEYQRFRQSQNNAARKDRHSLTRSSTSWTNLNQSVTPTGNSTGAGRINCMTFMPGNTNTILIGTACGGVWKSTDAGVSWTALNTDFLPSLSIASIAVDPLNTNNIYIATGDNFGGIPNFGQRLQGHYSAGVYKSTDGGSTWALIGPGYTQSQYMLPQQLIVDPVTPGVLLLASNTGVFRSTDSGSNWTNVYPGNYYSIEFNPLNHNVVYVTSGLGLYRSNNNGATWAYKGGGYPNTTGSRVTLGVTPADTNYVYLWGPTAGFKKSINGGTSFVTMSSPDALVTPYGYYDRAVAVSPTNKLEVSVGGLFVAKTINGGSSWAAASQYSDHLAANYTHQDIKRLLYLPTGGTTVYAMTDGGLYRTTNSGATWTGLNDGLQIGEYYRVASDPFSADTILFGAQDCASNRWDAITNTVTEMSSGDGMQPLFDYLDPNIMFVCKPYGNMQKSIDHGQTFALASAGQASWVSSYVMNPVNPKTMYCGCWAGVKKSYNEGTFMSWNNVAAGIMDSAITLAITPQDTNYVYAANYYKLVKSVNGGASWSNITGSLPVASAAITYIAVSPTDSDKIFVAFSGYSSGNKVYKTTDGGLTWSNYSGSLPNVPVNCILYQNNSADALYIGTDFGVFYRDSTSADWEVYHADLPNVVVNHLDIYYPTMKLRAATYGRGMWETGLDVVTDVVLPVELSSFTGRGQDGNNYLDWTTMSEYQTVKFEIERSGDLKQFSKIGEVTARGSSGTLQSYSYTDAGARTGIDYYRLRVVDLTGGKYSKIIALTNPAVETNPDVFPVPFSQQLNVIVNPTESTPTLISVTDVVGRTLYSKEFRNQTAAVSGTIATSDWNSGIYFVAINGAVRKIVKL